MLSNCITFSMRKKQTFHHWLPCEMTPEEWTQKLHANVCRTTHIWLVLLFVYATKEIYFNQSEALPRSEKWCIIRMEFLYSFPRPYLAVVSVLKLSNVSCFLWLHCILPTTTSMYFRSQMMSKFWKTKQLANKLRARLLTGVITT